MNFPQDLLYTKDHEWIRFESDHAVVGITDFAQSQLGDIVYVEIEALDQSVESNGIFGTIEAVKTVSDLFMPIAGTVFEVNKDLQDNPEIVNEDPYGKGWLVKVNNVQADEDRTHLMSADDYRSMVENA